MLLIYRGITDGLIAQSDGLPPYQGGLPMASSSILALQNIRKQAEFRFSWAIFAPD